MNAVQLLLAEIRYRKLNFLLALVAASVAVALFVAGPILVDGYSRETQTRLDKLGADTESQLAQLEDETRRLMRDMGFNLMIVHRDTNMSDFWAADFAAVDMPQEYVDRLAKDPRLTLVTHLVATLQSRVTWENRKVLLVGYLPESTQSHMKKKSPMGYNVKAGTVLLGHELGIGRKEGQEIEIQGRKFSIARILPEQGSKEDITLAVHLNDAQALLGKSEPPRINQIMALGCNCAGADLPNIRRQLADALPETRVTEFRSIAVARAEQREQVSQRQSKILEDLKNTRGSVQRILEMLSGVIAPIVVFACAVWIALLALANVRERRAEIGLLRALGKGSGMIAALFLGKAVLLGLVGAVIGFGLGTGLAHALGTRVLELAASQLPLLRIDILVCALIGAPLVCAVASYLPTLSAIIQDPAVVLRDA
jgi:hypothetical protein